jgi:hypothetical protein
MGRPCASGDTRSFVITRLTVMFENLIDLTSDVNGFDYLSKILLDLYHHTLPQSEEEAIKALIENERQLLGKLLVKAMKDQEELQLHFT